MSLKSFQTVTYKY